MISSQGQDMKATESKIYKNAMMNPNTWYASQKLILKEKAGWEGSPPCLAT